VPHGSVHFLDPGGFTGLGRVILDKLDRGVVLIDAAGRVIDANTLAARVLRAGDGIVLRFGRLAFANAAHDERLSQMYSQHCATASGQVKSIAAHLRRPDGTSYRVVVSAVPPDLDRRDVAFVALIYAPTERDISIAVLRELYGLTPAQAQVARNLFAGRSVEETAAALDLSLNTVRTHLKQVFTRCEVQSQAELLHLLAQGPQRL
jgi:DNA-binding CsgD family transcriptional regulator